MPATHTRLRTPGPTHEPQGLAPLRRELTAQNRRLRETLLNLDNLISPADWLDAGDGFPGFGTWRWNRPATRAQDRTHAPLSYLNEEEWRQHVALARDLVTRNHLALGFRDHVANFVGPVTVAFVLKGQAPGASASGPIDADGDGEPDLDPIVKEATQAWDEWRELAQWGEGEHDREAECRTRLIVEGECTLRFFVGNADSNGLPHVRHVEPELIRTPPGHDTTGSWGWGIKCADDDDECEDALWLCRPDNPNDGREVAASEYVRAKANVDRTVKRGLSDFFAVAEHLRKVLGLLDNMGHVARLQSAIAWWEQYPTATEAQVRAMIQSGTDYSRPKLAPGSPARTTDVQNYEPGSVIRTEAGRQVQPGPVATGVAGYAQVEALLLRAVGFRWGCPSYFSGDADATFASVLVTGSPFVRITEARQEKVKGFARAVARRVLEFCERTGRLPRGTTQRVRPIATARPVVIADEEKQARTFLALYQQNCADPIDFMRKRGDDPKVVAANIAAWHKKFPPPGTGADALPLEDDLAPAPPGSAGGDGTSPNDGELLGEARFFRGSKNKKGKGHKGKNEGDVWHGPSGRWFTLKNGHVVPTKAPGAKPTTGPNLAHAVAPGGARKTSGGKSTKGTPAGAAPPGGGKPGPSKAPKGASTWPDSQRHKAAMKLLQPSTPRPGGKVKEWMLNHLNTLHTDDLRLLIHHFAAGGQGRAIHSWATSANEVFQHRLAGGKLYGGNNPGWDIETSKALINCKLITGRESQNQDNFRGSDVPIIMNARAAQGKEHLPYARMALVAIPGDPYKNNGLYILPGFKQKAYSAQKSGGGPPYLVLSENHLNKQLDKPNGTQGVRKAINATFRKNVDPAAVLRDMNDADSNNAGGLVDSLSLNLARARKIGRKHLNKTIRTIRSRTNPNDLKELVRDAIKDPIIHSIISKLFP
ncbi:hypothetical protein J8F10_13550 [Gemmata sp. G18]|uniref:Uncharacterized protein n=1 Tax=Gemmata palustris TaxID=2822762 RepID=A0ABS5BRL4_9BACT|nr:hypothetical protein [Gemmata palustris]MBP3956310.1 hypothetical protein [Gemmata palustris]